MKPSDELARVAYAAYGKTTDFKNYQGLPMPEWDDLPERVREAWIAATEAVADALFDEPTATGASK